MHIVNDGSQALAKPEKVYEAEIVEEPARIVVVAMNAASEGESVAEPAVETVEEAAEVWMAAEYEDEKRTAEEISQLIYHLSKIHLPGTRSPRKQH